jgi:hypothetical protein
MRVKEVGISVSPFATVTVWECEQCHRRWSDTDRKGCPYCEGWDDEHRWDDVRGPGRANEGQRATS